jgi:arabinose-5-phosphate isomerase
MLPELLRKARSHLEAFFDNVDLEAFEKIFNLFLQCKGVLFFTGVGKSGLVAQKIAATMTSTGTKALALSPTDALHGDIGIVAKEDIFVILSKSGETEELLQILPYIRNKGATLVAVVSTETSRLAKSCNHSIYLPFDGELCPYDLAPTTSTTTQLIFGDILAIALMQAKNFTLNEYASNHPRGQIGLRSTILVRDLMIQGEAVPFASPDLKLGEVLTEFSEKRCGCLLVVDEGKRLQGIFTDGDLRRSLQNHGGAVLSRSLKEIMTPTPRAIAPNSLAWDALKVMEADQKKPITVLPVLDENQKVVGLIKMHDLIQSGV